MANQKSLDQGTLQSIVRQSGFSEQEWLEALGKK